MMASDDVTTDGDRMVSRADIAKLTLRLRAAQHEAEQAEANLAQAGSPDDARSAVRQRVDPLIEARREALAQQLEQARAEADAGLTASRAAAARLIASSRQQLADAEAESAERAPRLLAAAAARQAAEEQRHRDAAAEAARRAAEDAARLEAEEAARVEAEAESARLAAEEAARLEAEAAERAARFEAEEAARDEEDAHPLTPTLVESVPHQAPPAPQVIPIPLSSHTPTVEEQADATVWGPPAPSLHHVSAQAAVGPLPPTHVLLDAEAFARVFTNVVAQMLDERLPRMQHPQYPQYQQMPSVIVQAAPQAPAPQPRNSALSNARHLDVILAGVAMVIVLMVLAAWLV
ncbi:MAG: hypothetical protein RLZZ362_2551 [Actinomycetota bacterium]